MALNALQHADYTTKEPGAQLSTLKDHAPAKPKFKANVPENITSPVTVAPAEIEQEIIIDAAWLLDTVHTVMMHYVRWDNEFDPVIATLWVASTWFTAPEGKMLFSEHPRIFLIAPPGSGKTRIMRTMRGLVKEPTGIVKSNITAPGVRNALEAGRTIFLDEIDRQIRNGLAHQDLQALMSAYERDAGSLDGRSGVNEHDTFGPMVLAAKPRILTATGGWIEDLFERSFQITPVKHISRTDPVPELDEKYVSLTKKISYALETWAQVVIDHEELIENEGKMLRPIHPMPKAFSIPRMNEISSSLLAVADRAVNPDLFNELGQPRTADELAELDIKPDDPYRWAKMARRAVQGSLLGHGSNGAEMLADIADKMQEVMLCGSSQCPEYGHGGSTRLIHVSHVAPVSE